MSDSPISLINKIHEMDCLEGVKLLDNASVDLVLTDPPYNIGKHMKSRASGIHRLRENHFSICEWDNIEEEQWNCHMTDLATSLLDKLKPGGALIIFMAVIKVETIKKIFEEAGFYYKTTGTWHKKNPMPRNMNLTFINSTESWLYFTKGKPSGTFNNNGKAIHDFFETGLTPASEKRFGKHPTQKPLQLMAEFVRLLTNEGETILDPFCGSGTSLVAAKSLGRDFIGFDLNAEYIDISMKRINEREEKK